VIETSIDGPDRFRALPVSTETESALELVDIRKTFSSFPALDGANFAARRGEVHGLLGENGAGKSSLMNVAAGLYVPEAGRILVDGGEVELSGPAAAKRHGIGMVHQHFKLVKPFTVAENILLGNPGISLRIGRKAIAEMISGRADALGFAIDPERRIDTLSIAEQQRVEILKVLIAGARILILDEPTAVLTDREAEHFLSNIRRLARGGATVVLVTHKLAEVQAFCDRVTVMRGGRTLATVDARATTASELTRLAVGTVVSAPQRAPKSAGNARLYIAGLRCARSDGHVMLEDATFAVRDGEIYGIAGVSGNGQSELAEAIMGIRAPLGGSIEVAEVGNITGSTPERRRHIGIATIPADRYTYGLASSLSIQENFAIGGVQGGRYGCWARVDRIAIRDESSSALRAFEVQGAHSLRQPAALLSGGNAQKLVLARELTRTPAVIVAHSPSRGLDLRARAAVHEQLLSARDAGAAVLLISEDLDEVLNLSDRIGVMFRGRIAAEFSAPVDRQTVGHAMVAHA
jgi:general nucleoside transport system ATP-binding protein